MVNPRLAIGCKRERVDSDKALGLPDVLPELNVAPQIWICCDKGKKIDGSAYRQKFGRNFQVWGGLMVHNESKMIGEIESL